MDFFSSTDYAQRKSSTRESRRRSERKKQKRNATIFRSFVTAFSFLVIALSFWSLHYLRNTGMPARMLPSTQLGGDQRPPVKATELTQFVGNKSSPSISSRQHNLQITENQTTSMLPLVAQKNATSDSETEGSSRVNERNIRNSISVLQRTSKNDRKGTASVSTGKVDMSVPAKAPGLLQPATEAASGIAEKDESTQATDDSTEEVEKNDEEDAEGATEGEDANSETVSTTDTEDEDGEGAAEEDGQVDESEDASSSAFDDSIGEEEGGRAPVFKLSPSRQGEQSGQNSGLDGA